MDIPTKKLLLIGRIFLIASALLFAGMLYFGSRALSFRDSTIETEGTVVSYTQKDTSGTDGKTISDYYPVIEYRDQRGNSYRINPDVAMNDLVSRFIKGRGTVPINDALPAVKIRYTKTNPGEAVPAGTFFDMWGAAIVYGILALIFSITGTTLMQIADPESQRKK